MVKRVLAISLAPMMASIAHAGAVVTLDVPDHVRIGQLVQVQVSMTSDVDFDVPMRLQRLDLTGSDPAIIAGLTGPDDFPAGGDGIEEMVLEMGPFDVINALFPNFPSPQFVYNATADGFPPRMLVPGEPLRMGTIDVFMPLQPGNYLFDVVNAGADPDDSNLSAAIRYGRVNPVEWRGNTGEITGGQHIFNVVVPEPGSLTLLALGGVTALRRRRST